MQICFSKADFKLQMAGYRGCLLDSIIGEVGKGREGGHSERGNERKIKRTDVRWESDSEE
jgi:hypothetical protein